ncbi:hypothetical protein LCGC14_1229530 [marine sediment metagenome]|uniref:Uncharacterized protein n=1 Tax=marine sediment metagenome TaxID=412755 RepID=A0A0F9PDC0_9ZZZZ
MVKKYVIWFFLFVVLASSYYVLLPDKVRIDVQKTRTQYRVWEGSWVLSATEYVNLFDGNTKMRAKNRSIEWSETDGIIRIIRIANYKDSISTIETYEFDSTRPDVELVPTTHITRCRNCKGKILQFEYRDILYTRDTMDIISPFSFGHNMKIEWQDGAYRAKVYQQKVASDKIIIRYRPQSDYESFYVRLFDPPTPTKINVTLSSPLDASTSSLRSTDFGFNVTYNVSIDIELCSLYGNFSGTWKVNQTNTSSVSNATTTTPFTPISLLNGSYIWNVKCNNSVDDYNFGDNNFTINIVLDLNILFHSDISGLFYPVDYSIVNWTSVFDNDTMHSGNYTWNMTEYNVSAENVTVWLFNATNQLEYTVNVTVKQNQTKDWYEWWCGNLTTKFNISTTPIVLFVLGSNQDQPINCTLTVLNISQTYANWSLNHSTDRAIWDFNYTFNKTY